MMKSNSQTKKEEEQPKSLYNCPTCKDTGLIPTEDENGYTVYKHCKCWEMARVEKLWKDSGISINDIDKSFKNFESWNIEIRNMKDRATDYYCKFENIKGERANSIMMCGNPGCGKTHLAIALANNLMKNKQVAVVYMPYRDIITKLKQNMTDEEVYKKTLGKYQVAEVLLIDDLFKGKVNETDINIMFELINYRYLNRLPLIISTEFTTDKLLEFDEAVGSRIYEMCKGFITEIRGIQNNYRLK